MKTNMRMLGRYIIEHRGPTGNLKDRQTVDNIVVNQGLSHALSVITLTGTVTAIQTATGIGWFVGLAATAPNIQPTDTATSMGLVPLATLIVGPHWPKYTPGAIAANSIDNSATKARFTMITGGNIGAVYIISSDTAVTPTTGSILWGGASIATRTVVSGDTLDVQITIGAEVTG